MTAWAWAGLVAAAALATATLGDLISEEIRGWLDLVPHAILRLAATQLDPIQRETIYHDEWLPELCYALRGAESRPITRLVLGTTYATGLLISARRVAHINNRATRTAPGVVLSDDDRTPRQGVTNSPVMHKDIIKRIPTVTGQSIDEWHRKLESGPAFLRCAERAHWLAEQHGIGHGYASAIVHEYEIRRRARLEN
jgi:hypothetical protein